MPLFTFRSLRLYVLFACLLFSAVYTVHQLKYSRGWHVPLPVVIYPINADGSDATARYIERLSLDDFEDIQHWFEREARRFELVNPKPVEIALGTQIDNLPPELPSYNNMFVNMVWGLSFRWWVFRHAPDDSQGLARVRVFVLYHGDRLKRLPHSLGLQKGLLGLVNAYSLPSQSRQNNVVIAHEVLHTVGAVDKYRYDGHPVFPVGYGNPDRKPLHPQRSAEIMAGRIALSFGRSQMAHSLRSAVVGPDTAREINWVQ